MSTAARLVGLATASLLVTALAGCASDSAADGLAGSRDALDALTSLGIACPEPQITESTDVPFTRIACPGLQIEWVEDVDGYAALWRSDCAAVPADRRDEMAGIVIVTGDRWVIRGNGPDDVNAWPAQIQPEQAAARLGGEVLTAADYCARTGAWGS